MPEHFAEEVLELSCRSKPKKQSKATTTKPEKENEIIPCCLEWIWYPKLLLL